MNGRHTITGQHSTRCISWATQLRIFVPVVHTHITLFLHLYMFSFFQIYTRYLVSLSPIIFRLPSVPHSIQFQSFRSVPFRFTYFSNYSKHFVQRITYSAFVKRDGFFSRVIRYNTDISFILSHLVNRMQHHKCA